MPGPNTSADEIMVTDVKNAMTNIMKANLYSGNFIEDAIDLIEEDAHGTTVLLDEE